jgi:hypothetical protein
MGEIKMLWHFYGLQGSGKSVGVVIFAQDFYINKVFKVYANFSLTFGELLDMNRFLNFQYNNCVLVIDEAYGVAEAHIKSKGNDTVSWVILQSRKKDVEIFFATQNEGDLYKRIRESAHRKVLCENMGTDKHPILRYHVTNQYDRLIANIQIDEDTVKEAGKLFNTKEIIMPMYLNTGCTLEKVKEIFKDSKTKKTFKTLLLKENQYISGDTCEAIYDLLEDGKDERVQKLLKGA